MVAKGLCRRHYDEQRKARLAVVHCEQDGCGKPQFCKGLCRAHYGRLNRGRSLAAEVRLYRKGSLGITGRVMPAVMAQLREKAAARGISISEVVSRAVLLGLSAV